jgi:hypothetical protein
MRDREIEWSIKHNKFDWTTAKDGISDKFCRGFGDFPECPWGRGDEEIPENPFDETWNDKWN